MKLADKIQERIEAHTDNGIIRTINELNAINSIIEEYRENHKIPFNSILKRKKDDVFLFVIAFYVKSEDSLEVLCYDLRMKDERSFK